MSGEQQFSASESQIDQSFNIDETIAVPLHALPTAVDKLVPCIGIVWHPDFSRIGDIAFLSTGESDVFELSRAVPNFQNVNNGTECPLQDQRISRKPLSIRDMGKGQFSITPPASKMQVLVNGRLVTEPTLASLEELGSDIIISLSNSVILSVFMGPVHQSNAPRKAGILGISAPIQQMWGTLERAAATDLPILIRGETGTGKELAAQAVHAKSNRASEPLISVNMATLSSELGAADLFGAAKGAFTGAVRDRMGLFEQATAGSIFLDEIGETPASIQAMLLRVLETGEYRRVGESKLRKTAARIIAATDSLLDPDDFSQPLLRRLESITITMPPLRERRVDIGVMIIHFLSEQGKLGRTQIMAQWIASLLLYSWPGNVRELKNVVQQMMIDQTPAVLKDQHNNAELEGGEESKSEHAPKKQYRAKDTVTEAETLQALDDHDWSIKDAAEALNISRTILYGLMERFPSINRVDDLAEDDIKAVMQAKPDSLNDWAKELRVSKEALRRRIRQFDTAE